MKSTVLYEISDIHLQRFTVLTNIDRDQSLKTEKMKAAHYCAVFFPENNLRKMCLFSAASRSCCSWESRTRICSVSVRVCSTASKYRFSHSEHLFSSSSTFRDRRSTSGCRSGIGFSGVCGMVSVSLAGSATVTSGNRFRRMAVPFTVMFPWRSVSCFAENPAR